jgi:hypothetical protein
MSVRTATRNFDLLLAIAHPQILADPACRDRTDSDSAWRQQSGILFWLFSGNGRCRLDCLAGHYGCAPLTERNAKDNSTVLQSCLFSRGPVVGIVDTSQNQTRPARMLARPGTRSAGAVCRAAELEGFYE